MTKLEAESMDYLGCVSTPMIEAPYTMNKRHRIMDIPAVFEKMNNKGTWRCRARFDSYKSGDEKVDLFVQKLRVYIQQKICEGRIERTRKADVYIEQIRLDVVEFMELCGKKVTRANRKRTIQQVKDALKCLMSIDVKGEILRDGKKVKREYKFLSAKDVEFSRKGVALVDMHPELMSILKDEGVNFRFRREAYLLKKRESFLLYLRLCMLPNVQKKVTLEKLLEGAGLIPWWKFEKHRKRAFSDFLVTLDELEELGLINSNRQEINLNSADFDRPFFSVFEAEIA